MTINKLGRTAINLAPGVIFACMLAAIALLMQQYFNVPAILGALILGIVLSRLGHNALLESGVLFTGRTILRLGVALLGARISVSALTELGPMSAVYTLAVLTITLFAGYWIARRLRLSASHGWMTAGAVAICGASATLAIAAALPDDKDKEFHAATTVAAITLIGSIAMILYPYLMHMMGIDDVGTGFFLGASLHEVAQAAAAGFSVSPLAADTAIITKLIRVAAMAPVVIGMSLFFSNHHKTASGKRPALIPWFLIAFVVLAVLTNLEVIPETAVTSAVTFSKWALVASVAALGMKISLEKVKQTGARPLIAITAQTILCALAAFGALALQI